MSTIIAGLFTDSKKAGEAVKKLKNKGYTDNVSVIAKDSSGDTNSTSVKDEKPRAATTAAMVGGPIGALAGLFVGSVSAAIPGAILLVGGPLALIWGVTGAAIGALGGGLIGALVDIGFPEDKAKIFQDHILRGQVLIAITGDEDKLHSIKQSLKSMGATEIAEVPQA